MSLSDRVPDRELCEKWKNIGGRQDTEFAWKIAPGLKVVAPTFSGYNCEHESFAAPLEGEMMERLPEDLVVEKPKQRYRLMIGRVRGEYFVVYLNVDKNVLVEFWDKKLANALMLMAVGLVEGK